MGISKGFGQTIDAFEAKNKPASTLTPVKKKETEQERLRKKKASKTLLTGSQGAALEAGDTQAKSLLGQ